MQLYRAVHICRSVIRISRVIARITPLAMQLAELFVVKAVVLLTLSSHTLDIIQLQNYSNYGFNGSWVGWEVVPTILRNGTLFRN